MVLGNATYLVRIKSCECRFLQGVIFQVGFICIHNTTAVLGLGNIYNKSIFLLQSFFRGILDSDV